MDRQREITRTLELEAPPSRVWAAITEPNELAAWFPDQAELDVQPGGKGALTWEGHGTADVEVLEVEPLRKFVWRWSKGERPLSEYSTTVEWTLTPREGGGTTLHMRESGFDSDEHLADNTGGWTAELGELVEHLSIAA